MLFEKGNRAAAKPRIWERTVRRVIHQNPDKLRKAAEALVNAAADGDLKAIAELADRLDGKATQTVSKTVRHIVRLHESDELRANIAAAMARRSESTHTSVQ